MNTPERFITGLTFRDAVRLRNWWRAHDVTHEYSYKWSHGKGKHAFYEVNRRPAIVQEF